MYRRSISSTYTILARRCHPSFTHVLCDDNEKYHSATVADPSPPKAGNFQRREFCKSYNNATSGLGSLVHDRRGLTSSLPLGLGHSLCSYSSSSIDSGSDKVEYMKDVASVFTEKGMEAVVMQTPVPSEVAVAAADSFLPIAFLQYFIDGVHNLTGLNWWAAIALTTLFIRCCTVPLLISQLKATSKLSQMRPVMEEIRQQMQDSMDPKAAAEGQKRMKELFKEYGVHPLTPLKGLFIQAPVFISFYLAVTNMVEKVPSFKGGGAFWFTDLTTPDSLYIFPVLTASTFLLTVELNMQEGLEGNPVAGTMKKFSRIFAVLTVPFTMSFPKAIFCYWMTSNIFSLVYGLIIKRPSVKKFVGLPEIVPTPTPATQPNSSLFGSLFGGSKPLIGGSNLSGQSISATSTDSSIPVDQLKLPNARISSSSSNVGQRVSHLERTVKRRKKTKKN